MLMLRDYLVQNWALILVSLAFLISLRTTAFLDKSFARRMFLLIFEVLILSIIVFIEFEQKDLGIIWKGRPYLIFIRYSAGSLLEAQVLYSLVKKYPRIIFIPAIITAVICFISIYTGIITRVLPDGSIQNGPLRLLPFIVPGIYGCFIVYFLYKRTNKQINDLFPVAFFSLALGSMVILPFFIRQAYSQIFCKTISIALFAYYLFSIQNLTRIDSLTGVLNRQACYAELETDPEGITALVSIDMNGLKEINDTHGHAAGDEALTTLALCFTQAAKAHQSVYRIGGDEFLVICRQGSPEEVLQLVERIRKNVAATKYSCSIGYSCAGESRKSVSEMMKESDEMMYAEKARHYQEIGVDRRRN
ncbi:GGDEF domain-containing protein [Aristaeella hokkaidonensis]|uniref:GGDEF domain-containing protein n=1 Tax=Aristaeella hokkaidonensis TaxID=3046382 RepID=A0AC61MUT4_9FIRM|nr:GGDEF domain-containing protein [Aristaeella hokkaidonensis]